MTQLPGAARIEIERACERIVYAYLRALDLGEMSAAADFFAENGSFARPMAPEQVIQGRETIRAALLTRPKTLREGGEWKFLERRGSIQMKFFGTTA